MNVEIHNFQIATSYIRKEHTTSKLLGYHNFYNSVRYLKNITLYLFTIGKFIVVTIICNSFFIQFKN